MQSWARNAWTSLGVAERRADLWLSGALAWLVYLGWVPLVVTLVPLPDAGDLAFLAARLVPTGGFPVGVAALAAGITGVAVLSLAAAAAAEVAIQRALAVDGGEPGGVGAVGETLKALSISIIALIPAVVVIFGLGNTLARVAPIEYTSPVDSPILLRIVAAALPWEVALVATTVIGQAVGAVALQRSLGPSRAGSLQGLAWAVGDLVRHPSARLATAMAISAIDAVALVMSVLVLRALWAPVAADLAAGRLASPGTVLLLVGFMAIWLALLLLSGVLHVAASCWWRLEVGGASDAHRGVQQARVPEGGAG